jgi:hypothetical protein
LAGPVGASGADRSAGDVGGGSAGDVTGRDWERRRSGFPGGASGGAGYSAVRGLACFVGTLSPPSGLRKPGAGRLAAQARGGIGRQRWRRPIEEAVTWRPRGRQLHGPLTRCGDRRPPERRALRGERRRSCAWRRGPEPAGGRTVARSGRERRGWLPAGWWRREGRRCRPAAGAR